VSSEERAILIAAQKEAIRVLSEAGADAERLTSQVEAEAVALVLEQHENTTNLLHEALGTSTEDGHGADQAGDLYESHRTATELLVASEQELAIKLRETEADEAVDVLMAGHRRAAAILLDAWMRVTEGLPDAKESSP